MILENSVEIILNGHSYIDEIEELVKLFTDGTQVSSNVVLHSSVETVDTEQLAYAYISEDSVTKAQCRISISKQALFHADKALKWEIRRSVYTVLAEYTGKTLNWGVLTGIRPSKIVVEMHNAGYSSEECVAALKNFYFVSDSRINLLNEVAKAEKYILESSSRNNIAIYVGIPFCASRCLYCSFTSNLVHKYAKMVPLYTDALIKEIKAVSKMVADRGLTIESVYIGGGTPTAIDETNLQRILNAVDTEFELSNAKEFTVEAGRPDTITEAKLRIIKSSGATRISINPQTMNEEVLSYIGRKHSPDDILKAYNLARELGFDNINMDLIAGLPKDTLESFNDTLKKVLALAPESLTVHTFSVKRASMFNHEKHRHTLPADAAQMVGAAYERALSCGMRPYYMYRQRNILGNLENVGYCKPGYECFYNVQIMEEKQTILALGAGATSKIYYPDENRIERIFNVKSVEEYIQRIDEMIERKRSFPW